MWGEGEHLHLFPEHELHLVSLRTLVEHFKEEGVTVRSTQDGPAARGGRGSFWIAIAPHVHCATSCIEV